ncbi:B12-binding domain-containing radical SAM protein [Fusobacterium sp.]|uniref:B12-binding domain-containing radical SAM protein n=1 Tax=Fusobacterium sp. TaxID=68766 RepID=UPI00260B0EEF|nr:B12-binding domain-containing radical SAM protein [Fusobacterium sp.]
MSKNILVGINSKYVHTNLAVRYLKGFTEANSDVKIEIYESNINNNLMKIIRDIAEKEPEKIFFSTYIWNKEIVFKITKELRKALKDSKIILGGPEVSYNPIEIMKENDEIDGIIIGEGEKIILNYLTKDIKDVKGIYYREDGEIKFNGYEELIENLDIVPFPYTDEELKDIHKIIYYESSRGCPFSCSYCMSSIDKTVRHFSLERTKKDLKKFIDAGTKLVKFVDRTFNLKKERYLSIWQFLLDNYRENITFHFEINANIFDDEVLEFLKKVPRRFFQFEIGVQTINPKSMENIKRNNILDKLSHNVKYINKNIHLHLDLIAGLPYEDYESFGKSFDYVYDTGCEMIQLGFLKILKGTEMVNNVEKFNYKYLDFPPYEVLSNDFISYKEICRLKDIEEAVDLYYNSNKFKYSVKFIIDNFYESPFKFFEAIGDYFKKRGYFDIGNRETAVFNYLVEFYREKSYEKEDIFLEFLKMDYLLLGKPGFYPEWIESVKDKEKYKSALEKMNFRTLREAYKHTEIERFKYNFVEMREEEVDILFDYRKEDRDFSVL